MDHSHLLSVKPSQLSATLSFLFEDEITQIWQCVEIEDIGQGQNL